MLVFEGFDTRGCERVEIVDYGFVAATQVSRITVRAYYAGEPPRQLTVDLAARGINYETLVTFVRVLNARLRAQQG